MNAKSDVEIEVHSFDDIISIDIIRQCENFLESIDVFITSCGNKFYDCDQDFTIECNVDDEIETNTITVEREELHLYGFDIHKILKLRCEDLGNKVLGIKILLIEKVIS